MKIFHRRENSNGLTGKSILAPLAVAIFYGILPPPSPQPDPGFKQGNSGGVGVGASRCKLCQWRLQENSQFTNTKMRSNEQIDQIKLPPCKGFTDLPAARNQSSLQLYICPVLKPFLLFKINKQYSGNGNKCSPKSWICPFPFQLRHIFKVHPIYPGNKSQRYEN